MKVDLDEKIDYWDSDRVYSYVATLYEKIQIDEARWKDVVTLVKQLQEELGVAEDD